jgi:hypothetical protein
MIVTTRCPDCGCPAEVRDRAVLESTDGPIEHAKVACVNRHWYFLPVADLDIHAHNDDLHKAETRHAAWSHR